jgi:hypothetical protein
MVLGKVYSRGPGRNRHKTPGRASHMVLGMALVRTARLGPFTIRFGKGYHNWWEGPGNNRHKTPGRASHTVLGMALVRTARLGPFTIRFGKGFHNWCSCDHSKGIKCGYNGCRKKFHVDLVYNGLFL